MVDFKFATDSEVGKIEAETFAQACEALRMFVSAEAIEDGAWGWVEDVDGNRFKVGDDQ